MDRLSSTFAGHYDLAAYLVLMISIVVGLCFGFKNWFIRIFLGITAFLSFIILYLTVSRISFFALLFALAMLLVFYKKKWVIVCLFVLSIASLVFFPNLRQRFQNTVSGTNVLVDAKTGGALGEIKQVPSTYFDNKVVLRQPLPNQQFLDIATGSSLIYPNKYIPPQALLLVEPNASTGESLPQGTSYINLSLSPVTQKAGEYFFEKPAGGGGSQIETWVVMGDFLVKRARAYDLSFTTRFQGEWPNTLLAFDRNIFFGSGYGSVSLAVDNNYLRILGESGLLGFISYFSIFIVAVIYIKKVLPKVDSKLIKGLILGFIAGSIGLALNATLIDVFVASKIAFTYWLLMGLIVGILSAYGEDMKIDLWSEFKKAATSSVAIVVYLFASVFVMFAGTLNYYFVGDDFAWLRWVASCGVGCNKVSEVFNFFTKADGFFYRPGAKLYIDFMYNFFWLNQTLYHAGSILLHFLVLISVFFVAKKILKNFGLAVGATFLFLILCGYSEAVLWVSATGLLFTTMFALTALLAYINWKEKKKAVYFILSFASIILSLLFQEMGVIVPLLIILYDLFFGKETGIDKLSKKVAYLIILFPLVPYLIIRFIAQSHWTGGDYSYNLIKLPFNFIGNGLGYLFLTLLGPASLSFYEKLRSVSRSHVPVAVLGAILILVIAIKLYQLMVKKMESGNRKIIIFGLLFSFVSLLPFLGLGDITSRYSYLSTFGFVLVFVVLLNQLYSYLLDNGKLIANLIMVLIVIVFASFQLFQWQRILIDWKEAGVKAEKYLTKLDWIYARYSSPDTKVLYFVNVPVKNGNAWVFPVGLEDASWFVLGNRDVKVYQSQTVESAFDSMGNTKGKVFRFDNNDNFTEMSKTGKGQIIEVPSDSIIQN
jgi:hypothetical protein